VNSNEGTITIPVELARKIVRSMSEMQSGYEQHHAITMDDDGATWDKQHGEEIQTADRCMSTLLEAIRGRCTQCENPLPETWPFDTCGRHNTEGET